MTSTNSWGYRIKEPQPEPDADYVCQLCGYPLCTGNGNGWFCERCEEPEPLRDAPPRWPA